MWTCAFRFATLAVVLSKLNYADIVFGGCSLPRTRNYVQRLQSALDFVNNGSILKMEARGEFHLASLLFEIIKTKQPSYLLDKLNCSFMHVRHASRPHALDTEHWAFKVAFAKLPRNAEKIYIRPSAMCRHFLLIKKFSMRVCLNLQILMCSC